MIAFSPAPWIEAEKRAIEGWRLGRNVLLQLRDVHGQTMDSHSPPLQKHVTDPIAFSRCVGDPVAHAQVTSDGALCLEVFDAG